MRMALVVEMAKNRKLIKASQELIDEYLKLAEIYNAEQKAIKKVTGAKSYGGRSTSAAVKKSTLTKAGYFKVGKTTIPHEKSEITKAIKVLKNYQTFQVHSVADLNKKDESFIRNFKISYDDKDRLLEFLDNEHLKAVMKYYNPSEFMAILRESYAQYNQSGKRRSYKNILLDNLLNHSSVDFSEDKETMEHFRKLFQDYRNVDDFKF